MVGNLVIFWMWPHALWAMQCACHVSVADAKLFQWIRPHLLPHLLRWHSHILAWTAEEHLHQLCVVFNWFREYNLRLKPSKCSLFKEEINYLVLPESPRKVCNPMQFKFESDCRMCTTSNLHRGACLFWPYGPLLTVHKGLCMYCTAAEWTPNRRRS